MRDLISRKEVIKAMESNSFMVEVFGTKRKMIDGMAFCCDIAELPTVEAKPVIRGEWERVGSGSLYDLYECTNCHRPPKWDCLGLNNWRIAFTDICPHCGADMRKKVE